MSLKRIEEHLLGLKTAFFDDKTMISFLSDFYSCCTKEIKTESNPLLIPLNKEINPIYAGISIEEFISLIKKNSGTVFIWKIININENKKYSYFIRK